MEFYSNEELQESGNKGWYWDKWIQKSLSRVEHLVLIYHSIVLVLVSHVSCAGCLQLVWSDCTDAKRNFNKLVART